MFRAYQLTLNGNAQRLSDVFGLASTVADTDPEFVKRDLPMRQLTFQVLTAGSNPVYVGESNLVSSTVHGFRVDPTDTQQPIVLGPFDSGPLKLSDFWVRGTNAEVLVIGAIPY